MVQIETAALEALVSALAEFEVVDLTVMLAEHLPGAWPTHMPFQRKVYNWYASGAAGQIQPVHGFRGPYQTAFLTLDEHCGTHVDAPAHFIPPPGSGLPAAGEMNLMTGEKLDLTKMMGPAAVIDVTELSGQGEGGVSPEILPAHVERWEAAHGRLRAGDIVLFRSDWDDHYLPFPEGNGYVFDSFVMHQGPGWPTPGIPCLQLLLDRGITTLGLDGVSVGAAHAGAPPHQFGLGHGMLYIELLANLRRLPPRGAYFVFLPIKVEGASAGPGRAIGLVPRKSG
ncbi:MAG TPA: cyclase family protein [Thermomicrobiales bacterium]|jgi:kynurenine formamidase